MQHCLNAQAARLLEHDENFAESQFQCHQIHYVYDFVTSRLEIPNSILVLAREFGCKRDRITSALSHGLEPPQTRERHQGLSEDREQEIVAWISKYAAKSRPITRRGSREHVAAEYGVRTTRGWVNFFIGRHIGDLCFAKGSPQES
jgi:hypothetical protein